MKWLLLFLLSCSTAPSVKKLAQKNIQNKDCLNPLEDVKLSAGETFQNLIQQTAGTAGTVVATSAGVVSDTVVVGTGLAGSFYLCAKDSIFCDDIVSAYLEVMEEADMLWSTKKAYNSSMKWRCPQVDHISKAFRKVSSCLHKKQEYVAAFQQLSMVEENSVMADCMSDLEKEKIGILKTEMIYSAP